MLYVEPSVEADIHELVAFIREDDRLEAEAIAGSQDIKSPLLAFYHNRSNQIYSVFHKETHKMIALGGFDETGMVWLLMTTEPMNFAVRRDFLRVIRSFRDYVLRSVNVLYNVVAEDNHDHIRLLTAMGASFGQSETINGKRFLTFNIWR